MAGASGGAEKASTAVDEATEATRPPRAQAERLDRRPSARDEARHARGHLRDVDLRRGLHLGRRYVSPCSPPTAAAGGRLATCARAWTATRAPSASCEPSRPCSRRVWPRRRDGAPATSGGRSARTARRVSAASSARRRRRTRRAGRGVPVRGAHRRRPPTDPPTGTARRVPGLGLAARLPTPRRLRGRNRSGRAWRGRAGPRRT